MPSKRHKKTSDLFSAACEIAPDARAAFLEEACAGDTKLRAEVEALLAQHEQHPSFLNHPAWHEDQGKSDQETKAVRAERDLPGVAKRLHQETEALTGHPERVGPYKILQELGEGGMGIVYLAEQTEPIRRRVALKLIKLGMDTKQVIARFETERQALALMNHPNVATVLDAGATEKGSPYFVMEYVKGESITAYCDRHRLTTNERLELFMQVCQAVQHAHQKGIIHRDIKPSNVLVAVEGDKPVPKVIDFGVAKATEQKLTERTLFTEQGQLIGTPEYMSPEQAEMTALDIDTRTDIYSLGVILYELLVGALPFDPTSLRQAAFIEIQRIIREVEPPKPSTRLSSLDDESTSAAQKRHTDRTSLECQLRGDLDWITMKAIEKDRTRRYATAGEFADDILRHLNNEPVLAGPPNVGYRLGKFVRRNRTGVVATGAIAVVLLAATGVSIAYAISAKQAQADELVQRVEAETRRQEAEEARELAVGRLEDLQSFLAPYIQTTEHAVTRGAVDKSPLIDNPDEFFELIRQLTERAFGQNHVHVATMLEGQAFVKSWSMLWDQPSREDLLAAEQLLREALDIRRASQGAEHPRVAETLNDLGSVLRQLGDNEGSERMHRVALDILGTSEEPAYLQVADTLNRLSHVLMLMGDSKGGKRAKREAEKARRKAVEVARRLATTAHESASQGDYVKAESLLRECLKIRQGTLPGFFSKDHWLVFDTMSLLGAALARQEKFDEAEAFLLDGHNGMETIFRAPKAAKERALQRIVQLYTAWGKPDQAAEWRAKLPDTDSDSPSP